MEIKSNTEMYKKTKEIQFLDGKTVIFSTHRMGEINQVCDDIAIIFGGKLYCNDPLEKFKNEMTKPKDFQKKVNIAADVPLSF